MMGRLTYKGQNGKNYVKDDGYYNGVRLSLNKTADRLAAYEDTGMEPEDIKMVLGTFHESSRDERRVLTMAEYIEREALLKRLGERAIKHADDECTELTIYEDMYEVKNAPTADVVERKRGEWEFVEQRFYHGGFVNLFRCSECKGATDREHCFCPNCGAKMDGGNADA